jgi:hypothetical protein
MYDATNYAGLDPSIYPPAPISPPAKLIPYQQVDYSQQIESTQQQQGPTKGQNAWAKFLEASSGAGKGKDSTYGNLMKLGNIERPDFMGSLSGYGAGGEVQDLQPADSQPFMPQQEQSSKAKIYALLQKYYGDPALSSTTNVGIPN